MPCSRQNELCSAQLTLQSHMRFPAQQWVCRAAMSHHILCSIDTQSEEHDEVCEELEELGWEVCWDCGARTTEGNMDTHLAGRKYQQRMDLCSCDLCDVQDVSFKHMIEHLRGRRHQVVISALPRSTRSAVSRPLPCWAHCTNEQRNSAASRARPTCTALHVQAALNAKAAAKAAKPPPAPPAVAAPKPEALSMVTVRAALEEVCASAVSDVKRFLCCPITHVRSLARLDPFRNTYALLAGWLAGWLAG